jgi:hypothetical protein
MPCICYGAISGKEEYDRFLKSEKGQETLDHLKKASILINSFNVHEECFTIEFRQMFVKCLLHMLTGCDENMKPKSND